MFELLTLAWIIISATCLWVLIEQRKRSALFMFCFIPVFLAVTTSTFFTVRGMLGYPIEGGLPKEFVYISHIIREPDDIFIWIVRIGEKEPRSHVIPYTRADHRNILTAGQIKDGGGLAIGKFKVVSPGQDLPEVDMGDEDNDGEATFGGALEFYRFDLQSQVRKEVPNAVEPTQAIETKQEAPSQDRNDFIDGH